MTCQLGGRERPPALVLRAKRITLGHAPQAQLKYASGLHDFWGNHQIRQGSC
jgi:hypothetical protein